MRLDRRRLNWGVFLHHPGRCSAGLPAGRVSLSTLSDAWRLWPLVLVGIGLGLVLSRTPAYFAAASSLPPAWARLSAASSPSALDSAAATTARPPARSPATAISMAHAQVDLEVPVRA